MKMTKEQYDLVMKALLNAHPILGDVVKATNTAHNMITFDDCARVEKEIYDRINSANPFR